MEGENERWRERGRGEGGDKGGRGERGGGKERERGREGTREGGREQGRERGGWMKGGREQGGEGEREERGMERGDGGWREAVREVSSQTICCTLCAVEPLNFVHSLKTHRTPQCFKAWSAPEIKGRLHAGAN